jgi:hypothetical protein
MKTNLRSYKLRAECAADAMVLSAITPSLKGFTVEPVEGFPDVVVEFRSAETLEAIQAACNRVVDGHVMAQTVQLTENYTGERNYSL